MNVKASIKLYIDKFIDSIPGMKVLILDEDTKRIVSTVYTVTEISEKEVFLVEDLGSSHERMGHLKAICFIRPTSKSIKALDRELKSPKYGEYTIIFSNIVRQEILQAVAAADEHEVVRQVQEYFADYIALESHLFTLRQNNSLSLCKSRSKWSGNEDYIFKRSIQGVVSVLLSLKKRPLIRYQMSSGLAASFAREMKQEIDREDSRGDGLFDFRRDKNTSLLLVLDRRDDPITPLLSQWTYQAMVHELIGTDVNRVDMTQVHDAKRDLKEVVLNADYDSFYKDNQYSNFGDLGIAVKEMLETYSKKSKGNAEVTSIEDMQKFVENYPEFKKLSNNVSKHVAVMSELAHVVDERMLMDLSALEQEMACGNDHSTQCKELFNKLKSRTISDDDALRLVMLYAIRYEKYGGNQLRKAISLLSDRGISASRVALVDELLSYAGVAHRSSDLFGDDSAMSRVFTGLKRELKGVSNVYTQHKPLLAETLDLVKRGKLKESNFPYEGRSSTAIPNDVIVFIVGGTTYEEAMCVKEINDSGSIRVVLGGSSILNSTSFISSIANMHGGGGGERRIGFGEMHSGPGGANYGRITNV